MDLVIKIGGSLIDTAGNVLKEIEDSGVSALIIPGGGVFADSVRAANPDDDTAHWEAITSMNRYGRFLSTFGYAVTESLEGSGIRILLPEKLLRAADPLPHSWDVTSDSIALWTAKEMGLPLLLVKSRGGTADDSELVDAYFSCLLPGYEGKVAIANGREAGSTACQIAAMEATRL